MLDYTEIIETLSKLQPQGICKCWLAAFLFLLFHHSLSTKELFLFSITRSNKNGVFSDIFFDQLNFFMTAKTRYFYLKQSPNKSFVALSVSLFLRLLANNRSVDLNFFYSCLFSACLWSSLRWETKFHLTAERLLHHWGTDDSAPPAGDTGKSPQKVQIQACIIHLHSTKGATVTWILSNRTVQWQMFSKFWGKNSILL